MNQRRSPALAGVLGAAFVVLSPALARPARALEVVGFVSEARPAIWRTGVGATVTSGFFRFASLEAELARQPGEPVDSSMTSFMGSALLSPPLGPLVPFGGFGVGLYRQSRGELRDNGTLTAFILGVKLKLGGVVVIRGEYRAIDLSDGALLEMDERFALGIGVSF